MTFGLHMMIFELRTNDFMFELCVYESSWKWFCYRCCQNEVRQRVACCFTHTHTHSHTHTYIYTHTHTFIVLWMGTWAPALSGKCSMLHASAPISRSPGLLAPLSCMDCAAQSWKLYNGYNGCNGCNGYNGSNGSNGYNDYNCYNGYNGYNEN